LSASTDEHPKGRYNGDNCSTNLVVTTSAFVIKTAGLSYLLLPLMLVCFMPPHRSHELFTMVSARSIHNNALQHRTERSLLSAALRLWYRMAARSAWGDSVSRGFLDANASGYLLNRATNIRTLN